MCLITTASRLPPTSKPPNNCHKLPWSQGFQRRRRGRRAVHPDRKGRRRTKGRDSEASTHYQKRRPRKKGTRHLHSV